MKSLFLVLAAAVLFTACNNTSNTTTAAAAQARQNTDLIQQHLKGKVESLTETSYAADSTDKMGKMDSVIGTTTFDEKGYISKYQEKDSAGKLQS